MATRWGNRFAVDQSLLAIPWVKTQGYSWRIALRYSVTKRIEPSRQRLGVRRVRAPL